MAGHCVSVIKVCVLSDVELNLASRVQADFKSPSELTLSTVPSSRLATFNCFEGAVNWMRSPWENSRSTSRCTDTPDLSLPKFPLSDGNYEMKIHRS